MSSSLGLKWFSLSSPSIPNDCKRLSIPPSFFVPFLLKLLAFFSQREIVELCCANFSTYILSSNVIYLSWAILLIIPWIFSLFWLLRSIFDKIISLFIGRIIKNILSMLISTNSLFLEVFSEKSLKSLKKRINKLWMIRWSIYETYKSYKLDKKKQFTIKDTFEAK